MGFLKGDKPALTKTSICSVSLGSTVQIGMAQPVLSFLTAEGVKSLLAPLGMKLACMKLATLWVNLSLFLPLCKGFRGARDQRNWGDLDFILFYKTSQPFQSFGL